MMREIYKTTNYTLDGFWKMSCWVQALEKLNELKNNDNVINVGHFCWGGKHAWIEYTIKEKDGLYRVGYDPAFDKEFFKVEVKEEVK